MRVFVLTGMHVFVLTGMHVFVLTGMHVFVLTGMHVFVLTGMHVFVLTGMHVFVRVINVVSYYDFSIGFGTVLTVQNNFFLILLVTGSLSSCVIQASV
jgi:hypothetical protein